MMRFLLVFTFSFSLPMVLTSCTSSSNSNQEIDELDAGDSASGDLDEGSSDGEASADEGSDSAEDDIESELDQEDQGEGQQAVSEEDSGKMSEELAEEDTLSQPLKNGEDVQAENTPPAPVEMPPAAPQSAKIRDIRYLANSNGGTVVIETSRPVTYQTRFNAATRQYIIEVADVELPPSLQRPYVLKNFNSRFGGINAYQSEGSKTARIVLQLTGVDEPVVQQEGTTLVVIPPAPSVVAESPTQSTPQQTSSDNNQAPKPTGSSDSPLKAKTLDEFLTGTQVFYGRVINVQVKDADVRDVINFISEESGANIVMSEDVKGKISLKLRKTPWDQALVTVMRTVGLGYVRQGNVLRISSLETLRIESEATNRILELSLVYNPKFLLPAIAA